MFEYALLVYERHTCRRRTIGMRVEAIYVFGMNRQSRASVPPLVEADAEVFERGVIQIETLTRGPEYPNELMAQVQNLPELCLLFLQPLFGVLAFVDVGQELVPADHPAFGTPQRQTAAVKQPVRTV